MSEYPESVFSPRAKANRDGVVYDASKERVIYVEDMQAIENEIISIEQDLEKFFIHSDSGPWITDDYIESIQLFKAKCSRDIKQYENFGVTMIDLPAEASDMIAIANDYTTYFFLSDGTPSRLFYFDFANDEGFLEIDLPAGSNTGSSMLVYGGDLYISFFSYPARIVKVNLSDYENVQYLDLPAGNNYATSLTATADYLYVGLSTSPGSVVRVKISDFTYLDTTSFVSGENYAVSLFTIYETLFVTLYSSPGYVVALDLDTMLEVYRWSAPTGFNLPITSVSDGSYLYVGFDCAEGYIVKLKLTDLTQVSAYSSGDTPEPVSRLLWDGVDVFAIYKTSGVLTRKIKTETMIALGSLLLPVGFDYTRAAMFGHFGLMITNYGSSTSLLTGYLGDIDTAII